MKKWFLLVLCLLLCGCQATNNGATEPAQPEASMPPEQVTVYLLEKSVLSDSGFTQYFYDGDYNIIRSETYTIENELMHTTQYKNLDENGMFGSVYWANDGETFDRRTVIWQPDGKIQEEQSSPDYSGFRYEYSQEGRLVKKQEYYENELFLTVHYAYDGDTLDRIYCIDAEGRLDYECRIENGRIAEKTYYTPNGYVSYSYTYRYDANGNLEQLEEHLEDYVHPSELYSYKAVTVDAQRAVYLLGQQRYLLSGALEYIAPTEATSAQAPELQTGLTVEQLRQQMAAEGKPFAVAYLGYMNFEYETVGNYIDALGEDILRKIPFLTKIPQSNWIASAYQGEVYCIIPADPEALVEIYTGSYDTTFDNELYAGSSAEPFLLVCNASTPDAELRITEPDGTCTVWNPILDAYMYVQQPGYAEGGRESLDFSPYNEMLLTYYEEMLADPDWTQPSKQELEGTIWYWDAYTLDNEYCLYKISFHKDTIDIVWNTGSGDNYEYNDAKWSYEAGEVGVLTIDLEDFAGVRKYNLLVDWENDFMYIAVDATGKALTWDSEPQYRFLLWEH